jgi:ATP-binding cassette subfamily C protein CydD
VVALATLGTAATVVIAWHVSLIVTKVFIEHSKEEALISSFLWVASAGATKALVIWLQELASARSSNTVKVQLRTKLYDSIFKLGSIWLNKNSLAEINILSTTGLNSLDSYFSKYLPQLIYTALVTPVFVMVIWATDIASGITLIATLPLIPIFMILIGWATQTIQQKQLDSLTRLTQHFLEVLRGLTTLRVFGRAKAQVAIIDEVSEQYRVRTMAVLRITFLSGFALELIASLSVALIAVSIGLRLVNGEMSLLTGLFILLLAPEAYLPIRQVGAHFHAAIEGVAASQKVLDIIDLAKGESAKAAAEETYEFGFGQLTAITGPSGTGKSTIFKRKLGLAGSKAEINFADAAWMPQRPALFNGTVQENITGTTGEDLFDKAALAIAVRLAALDDLVLSKLVDQDGGQISGGQAQRVSLARCFYRAIVTGAKYILLDEPVSALDEKRTSTVLESLKSFALEGRAVVAITHQPQLIRAADIQIVVSHA